MKPKRYVKEFASDMVKRIKSYDWLGAERINEAIDFYKTVVREHERGIISACEAVQAIIQYDF